MSACRRAGPAPPAQNGELGQMVEGNSELVLGDVVYAIRAGQDVNPGIAIPPIQAQVIFAGNVGVLPIGVLIRDGQRERLREGVDGSAMRVGRFDAETGVGKGQFARILAGRRLLCVSNCNCGGDCAGRKVCLYLSSR